MWLSKLSLCACNQKATGSSPASVCLQFLKQGPHPPRKHQGLPFTTSSLTYREQAVKCKEDFPMGVNKIPIIIIIRLMLSTRLNQLPTNYTITIKKIILKWQTIKSPVWKQTKNVMIDSLVQEVRGQRGLIVKSDVHRQKRTQLAFWGSVSVCWRWPFVWPECYPGQRDSFSWMQSTLWSIFSPVLVPEEADQLRKQQEHSWEAWVCWPHL